MPARSARWLSASPFALATSRIRRARTCSSRDFTRQASPLPRVRLSYIWESVDRAVRRRFCLGGSGMLRHFGVVTVVAAACTSVVVDMPKDSGVVDTGRPLVLNGQACAQSAECASNCCYAITLVCGPEVSPNVDTTGQQACTCTAAGECANHHLLVDFQSKQPANDPCSLACGPRSPGAPSACLCGRG